MIIGNNKKFKGTGIVCFIDILGFSDDIINNWKNSDNNPLEKLIHIKKSMPIYDEIDNSDSPNIRKYIPRVDSISDSFIISFGYNEPIIIGDLILGIHSIIGNIIYIWNLLIEEGYTIRGAIDFGDIYWDENDIIGPAFISTYRYESSVAKISRIIIGSKLNKNLARIFSEYKSTLTDHLIQLFRKDIDGYIILNPRILFSNDVEQKNLIIKLTQLRDSIKNPQIQDKYNPLIEYLKAKDNYQIMDIEFGKY